MEPPIGRPHVPGLIAVYRFGSFGTPDQRADSDIDLGLQADRPLDPVMLFRLSGELATTAGREIDLVDMIGAPRSCLCDSFAATVFSQYPRLNEERRGILDDIQATGSIHGR